MALTSDQKIRVSSALARLERDGLITRGRSADWLANQTPRPIARGYRAPTAESEVSRLKKKVNRVIRAENSALLDLVGIVNTASGDTKRAITRAIDKLSV